MAYQGYARGIDFEIIEDLNQVATGGLRPELTILFDLESSEGLSRLHPGGHDRLEREAIEFHHKVRDGYHQLVKKEPQRWKTIDASKPMTTVQTELRKVLSEQLSGKFDLSDL